MLLLLTITVLYAIFTTALWLTWFRLPVVLTAKSFVEEPKISVIIPVRNEEVNLPYLLQDLESQTYRSFEVIVADDASTDNTRAIAQQYANKSTINIKVISLSDNRTASPKKRAISESISQATGNLIVTTDGDCRVAPGWLAAYATCYQRYKPRMITGPVTFMDNTVQKSRSLFNNMQIVEFASLVGAGACTLAWSWPTMCNGANLCYEKQVFQEVGGFTGVDHLASGDDELLMHKIADRYPGGVRFLKNADAIVQTDSLNTLQGFYQQRKRWASKWRGYQSKKPLVIAMFVFLSNLMPVLAILGWLVGLLPGGLTAWIVALKVVPEFFYLRQILLSFGKYSSVKYIPLTQIVYPLYVLFFGLVAQGKGYEWKGRKLT